MGVLPWDLEWLEGTNCFPNPNLDKHRASRDGFGVLLFLSLRATGLGRWVEGTVVIFLPITGVCKAISDKMARGSSLTGSGILMGEEGGEGKIASWEERTGKTTMGAPRSFNDLVTMLPKLGGTIGGVGVERGE